MTDELNHIKDNETHYSGYIGLHLEHTKIGVSNATNEAKPSFRIEYKREF